jgi:hypothetical protein
MNSKQLNNCQFLAPILLSLLILALKPEKKPEKVREKGLFFDNS